MVAGKLSISDRIDIWICALSAELDTQAGKRILRTLYLNKMNPFILLRRDHTSSGRRFKNSRISWN